MPRAAPPETATHKPRFVTRIRWKSSPNLKPVAIPPCLPLFPLPPQVAQAIYKHQDGLRVLFYRMDVSGSGGLDRSTFKEGLRSLALVDRTLTDADLELVADFVDRDSDGTISWDEFLTAFGLGSVPVSAPASGRASPAVLRSALY